MKLPRELEILLVAVLGALGECTPGLEPMEPSSDGWRMNIPPRDRNLESVSRSPRRLEGRQCRMPIAWSLYVRFPWPLDT